MKAISLIFQRNGVAGEPFFQFVYLNKEQGFKKQMKFVATFTTSGTEDENERVNFSSCRVTSPDYPNLKWRGDVVAGEIQKYFQQTWGIPEGGIYDLIEKINTTTP
jgi:hypothetical protein